MNTNFVTPGTLVKPGVVGRMIRFLSGLFCCYAAIHYGSNPTALIRPDLPNPGLLIGPAIALWLLPPVVNLGFGRNWGNRSQVAFLALAALTTAADYLLYGTFWGLPLGSLVYGLATYTFAHLGISFLLAAMLGTPGCEMRAIPDLIGRLRGRTALEHHCPGPFTPLDNWESARRHR